MKRIRTTTLALFLTLMLVVSSIAVIPASAAEVTTEESGAAITIEESGFSWPNKGTVTCYTLSNGRVNTYSNAAATNYTGWIDGKADQCKIIGYNKSNMTFKVQYPTSKGTKTAWTKMSNFIYNTNYSGKTATMNKSSTVYTKSDLSKAIGTAYKGDRISIVSTKGNLYQIVYPVGSNWKMGWVQSGGNKNLSAALYNNSGAYISCSFDGYKNTKGRHEGIDVKYKLNAPIYSLTDGVIVRVAYGKLGSSGLSTIAIYNSATNKTVIYLHSAPVSGLYAGKTIKKGDKIGVESWRGVSGSNGAHTHVEVRNGKQGYAAKSVNDYKLDNTNPTSFWNSMGYTVK